MGNLTEKELLILMDLLAVCGSDGAKDSQLCIFSSQGHEMGRFEKIMFQGRIFGIG